MTTIVRERVRSTPNETAPAPGPAPLRAVSRHAPLLAARVSALLGVLALIDVTWAHPWHVLRAFDVLPPGAVRSAVRVTTAVSALLLLRIAAGLRRCKRAEWRVAVAASAAIAVVDLVRGGRRPVEGALAIVLLVVLIVGRSRFRAVSDPRSRWFALRSAARLFAFSVVLGTGALLLPGSVPTGTSLWARLHEVLTSLVGLGGWVDVRGERFSDSFHATMLALGLLTIVWTMFLLLRPAAPVAALSDEDEGRLRALLVRHGSRDSLGYFALRRDKQIAWSPSGKAAVAYRVVSGVALVSADPIGDPEAWPGAISAYADLVAGHGWTPAVMGCSELGASVFARECGLVALNLGDEAILHVDDFALDGRSMRGVRQACARIERAGYSATIRRVADLSALEITELRARADSWRTDPTERGFSMALSRLGDPADGDCVIVTAEKDGELRGLLHFVPWGTAGISLDLMRRERGSDNGLNEYMITTVMQACRDLGVERVSLNFAVFRDALERGARIGAGPVLRLWRRTLLIASRWWQIDTLYRFNSKFRPAWEPRFICYPRARDIPRIALAALEAEAFLVRPATLDRLLGRA